MIVRFYNVLEKYLVIICSQFHFFVRLQKQYINIYLVIINYILEDILFVIITTSSYMYVNNYIWRERSQMTRTKFGKLEEKFD